ncbi:hypothetical protein CXB36_17480 [Pseudomonas syringae pv. syringae]|nr:hypothetical protein [Pseudomonas syringae]POP63609.1 hypothetical protein CXB36_17480 [Pseudomonas syringae pv. syringae]
MLLRAVVRKGSALAGFAPGHLPPPTPRTSPTEPSPVPVWPLSVLECSVEGVHQRDAPRRRT